MSKTPVIRMWITNKMGRNVTTEMNEAMISFLSTAVEHGCNGSTFAEDSERVIVYTVWSDEKTLEQFRVTEDYKVREKEIIQSFMASGFEIPGDILFNSTAKILFAN